MVIETPIRLTTHIADVPGVGPKRAEAFRRMGIRCVADLIRCLPLRYEHELAERPLGTLNRQLGAEHGSAANLAARGEIASVRIVRARRHRVEATLEDGTGTVLLTWFNSPWLRDRLHPGMRIAVSGKAKRHGDYVQIINPQWVELEAQPQEEPAPRSARFRPVYPATEGLPSAQVEKAVSAILDPVLESLEDHLYAEYRRRRALPTLAEAYRMLHRPRRQGDVDQGRRRLAFDELLMLQLGVMLKRRHRRAALAALPLKHTAAIQAHIQARFPFTLTNGQSAVIEEIVGDLRGTHPMNRLLQGDVGAGKTVVALYAMLLAVASGHQACLMAPTALLAEQHHASITAMLKGGRVSIELLTGNVAAPQRRAILKRLADGEINLLIGTHALLTQTVRFRSLALAVIDEQHRFGVHQRAGLRAKSSDAALTPHTLVLTATPIPRTLSLTLYGDLDISTIRELPPGRKPIITRLVSTSKGDEVYAYVAQRLDAGEQAYIVVPVVDESAAALKDVRSHLEWLEQGPFQGKRLAAVHGRLKREARESVMERFRRGEVQALVATTVIEVGVDVPAASILVIEHADRFGLAQLHQLRGRIGRGTRRSLCVLIADPVSEEATARLQAIASTTDGFKIAEMDLNLRGPGDLFGARQSGAPPFLVARLPDDLKLLQLARRDARQWIVENPDLTRPRDALLRKRLLKAHGKWLGLGDVA